MISAQHLHLLLTHVPVMAVLFSLPVLAFGMWRRNTTAIHIALIGFIAAAIVTIPVFLSGEGAEEAVEHLPGVTEFYIEQHEESAERTLWLVELLGIASLGLLVWSVKSKALQRGFLGGVLLLGILTAVSIGDTANLGGQVRHTEIRANAGGSSALTPHENSRQNSEAQESKESKEHKRDDDDR